MSDSYRTMKTQIQAWRRMPRDAEGDFIFPTVIARKPKKGDIHPLPKSLLLNDCYRCIPPEYLNGLRRIELLPRTSDEIGRPFGTYFVREKRIALYSLPREWSIESSSDGWRTHLSSFGALVRPIGDTHLVVE